MNARILIEFLRIAVNSIDPMYFGQRIESNIFERYGITQNHPKRELLEKYLSRYGERVFCYELYHQIRMMMENYEITNPDEDNKVYFQGELRKGNVEEIIELFEGVEEALTKEYIPDFLLHSPGDFMKQELVIEVKSNPSISIKDITDDLQKIQEFLTRYSYNMGIFLLINAPLTRFASHFSNLIDSKWFENNLPNRDRIIVVFKERPETPLFEYNVSELNNHIIDQ